MVFSVNYFDVLDVVGDDDSELPLPVPAAAPPKSLKSPAPAASKEELSSLPQSEYGRGRGRGAQGGQKNGSQEIHEEQNSQDKSNGYGRCDGKVYQQRGGSNGYRRYNGHNEGYPRHDGRANGYQEQNRENSDYRKNKIREQNNADSTDPYRRDSSSTEDNGSQQLERRTIGGCRRRNFIEDNQHESKWLDGDSGLIPLRSPGDKFHGEDANQAGNRRFNSGWERRSNRGVNSGNWNHESRSFDKGGNGEVKTSGRMETPGDDELPVTNGEESANMDLKESVETLKEAEPKGSGKEIPAGNDSKEQKEEEQNMTLREYEKQLLEKRKALEALKKEERKVTLDKDFESMQLVGRKKGAFGLSNPNSEKEKLKKEDMVEKDEKLRKSMSIEEFQSKYGSGAKVGHRGGRGGGFRGGLSRPGREDEGLDIQNSTQFPGLSLSGKVA